MNCVFVTFKYLSIKRVISQVLRYIQSRVFIVVVTNESALVVAAAHTNNPKTFKMRQNGTNEMPYTRSTLHRWLHMVTVPAMNMRQINNTRVYVTNACMQRGSRSVGILLSFITLLFYHFASVERETKKNVESIVCRQSTARYVDHNKRCIYAFMWTKWLKKMKKEKPIKNRTLERGKRRIQRLKGNLQLAGLAKQQSSKAHTYHVEQANRRISIEQIDET